MTWIFAAEVWPFAADKIGIHLLTSTGAWPTNPLEDEEADPEDYVELELIRHGVPLEPGKQILHQTSTRIDRNFRPAIILTYAATVRVRGLVKDMFPDSRPISLRLLEEIGKPPSHPSDHPGAIRYLDCGVHALRHVAALTDPKSELYDEGIAADLPPAFRPHLKVLRPALYTLYRRGSRAA